MGFGTTELIIVLVIVALIFGTKKLKSMGSDLGGAVKGFKTAMHDDQEVVEEKIEQSSDAKDVN